MNATNTPDLAQLFPINSQTSESDKHFLLDAISVMGDTLDGYAYLEIGSFLGGSMTPFLQDTNCRSVLSIDDRGRAQPDERGVNYDYGGITHDTMREKLESCGQKTDKLATFDGSVHQYKGGADETYALSFIDGEHTDVACFRDFLWTLPLTPKDSIIMFHDSRLVFRALQLINLHLEKEGVAFRFIKKARSDMSACLLGKFANDATAARFGPLEPLEDFYVESEAFRLVSQARNRLTWRFAPEKLKRLKLPIAYDARAPRTEKAFKDRQLQA